MDPPVAIGAGTSEAKESVFSSPATFECQSEGHRRRKPHPHRPGTMWQRVQASGPGLAGCLGNFFLVFLLGMECFTLQSRVFVALGKGCESLWSRSNVCRKAYLLAGGQLLVPRTMCQAQSHLGLVLETKSSKLFPQALGQFWACVDPLPGAHDPFCSSLPGVLEVVSR